jgi:hypothetical protein
VDSVSLFLRTRETTRSWSAVSEIMPKVFKVGRKICQSVSSVGLRLTNIRAAGDLGESVKDGILLCRAYWLLAERMTWKMSTCRITAWSVVFNPPLPSDCVRRLTWITMIVFEGMTVLTSSGTRSHHLSCSASLMLSPTLKHHTLHTGYIW